MLGQAKQTRTLSGYQLHLLGNRQRRDGFADAGSDGIIQFSTGGAEFGSARGPCHCDRGAAALAEFTHVSRAKYPVNVALYQSTTAPATVGQLCPALLAISAQRVSKGGNFVPVAHVGRSRSANDGEPGHRPGALLRRRPLRSIGVVWRRGRRGERSMRKLYTSPED